jgi:diaminopropionate ammonia-lyase
MPPKISAPTPAYANPTATSWTCAAPASDVSAFHAQLPDSAPTRLVELPELAAELGVGRVFVKDESSRLGLPAFKALGVSYAIYRVIARRADRSFTTPTIDALRDHVSANPFELVTATDGNHGHALARMARLLGLPARVFIPSVVDELAVQAIAGEDATVILVDADYDEAVRRAAEWADGREDAELVQDTSWPGYEQTPQWIVDGYSTLFAEIDTQLADLNESGPDAVFVPVGVGSLAQAATAHYRSSNRVDTNTALICVEPDTAACVQQSLRRGDLTSVPTESTIMAGLNCGTPSTLAWPYLRNGLAGAVTVTDAQSQAAVAELGRLSMSSGPCGAATLAAARAVFLGDGRHVREQLNLDADSTIVLLSTEGIRRPATSPPSK